jgi:hypothetical protein
VSESEVAQLKKLIAEEYIAAKLGLEGPADGTAQHQFITRHMEAMGKHLTSLEALVGPEQAGKLMAEVLEPL